MWFSFMLIYFIYGATISLLTKFSLSAEAPVLADGGSLKWLIGIYCHISCKEGEQSYQSYSESFYN